jgi:asparagine synthase (glutamine-hydrolysing)
MIAELGRRHDATAVLTGQGGDAVFFQMPTPLVVADLVQARGRRAAFGAEAQATARWLRRSIWSLARQPRRLAAADLIETALHGWLGARAREGRVMERHAWLKDLGNTPPGKQLQIQTLCAAQMKFGRTLRSEALVVRHPLLSQPVVELCLGIPSWRLTGGRDRGFARAAFAHRLPPRVVHRRSKGVLSTLYAKRLAHSLDVVRPWLLDGALCRAEVLDRAALEAALTPEALLWEGQASRLTWAACLEGWVRYWQGRVPDASLAARGDA